MDFASFQLPLALSLCWVEIPATFPKTSAGKANYWAVVSNPHISSLREQRVVWPVFSWSCIDKKCIPWIKNVHVCFTNVYSTCEGSQVLRLERGGKKSAINWNRTDGLIVRSSSHVLYQVFRHQSIVKVYWNLSEVEHKESSPRKCHRNSLEVKTIASR